MIEIIEEKENHKKEIICSRCGSKLRYGIEDTEFHCDEYAGEVCSCITLKCPKCENIIFLK